MSDMKDFINELRKKASEVPEDQKKELTGSIVDKIKHVMRKQAYSGFTRGVVRFDSAETALIPRDYTENTITEYFKGSVTFKFYWEYNSYGGHYVVLRVEYEF